MNFFLFLQLNADENVTLLQIICERLVMEYVYFTDRDERHLVEEDKNNNNKHLKMSLRSCTTERIFAPPTSNSGLDRKLKWLHIKTSVRKSVFQW